MRDEVDDHLINSMAAVRHLVYETKKLPMETLVKALDADFAGYEEVKKLCEDAPKYGNDNEMVDDIAGEMFTFIADEIESYKSKFGTMTPGILPVSGNTPFGLESVEFNDLINEANRKLNGRHDCQRL